MSFRLRSRSNSSTDSPGRNSIDQRKRGSIVGRADNLSVALSGGKTKSKKGTLKKKNSGVFGSKYRDSIVSVDDGDISFINGTEEDGAMISHSLFEVREIKLVAPGSNEFQVRIGAANNRFSMKTVVLKADTHEEALDWIETLKHEMKNQVLVCFFFIDLSLPPTPKNKLTPHTHTTGLQKHGQSIIKKR